MITVFEYLAETQPEILLRLALIGLLDLESYIPEETVKLMCARAYLRVKGRLRQKRAMAV